MGIGKQLGLLRSSAFSPGARKSEDPKKISTVVAGPHDIHIIERAATIVEIR